MAVGKIAAQEFEQRYNRVRKFLDDQGLGALFVYSPPEAHHWGQTGHVSYLSGWANLDRIVDSAVIVPVTGRPVLLFAGMPFLLESIGDVCPLQDVRLVRAVDPQAVAVADDNGKVSGPRYFADETAAILQENGLQNKDIGVVGVDNMSVPFYEALSHRMGEKLKRVRDIVAELRSIKSPAEVENMRRAAQLSDLGFQTMLKTARAGMRGIEIVAEMERVVRREGADHAKYWMASGPPPDWANARLELKPHQRRLEDGDLMAACSYVLYQGYWCHGQRTGSLTTPSPELNKIYGMARESQDVGLETIKPGVPVGHVGKAVRKRADELGIEIDSGRIGHGMGMDYSELPGLTESNEEPLQAGMTFVVHSVFSLPDSGKMFVPLGDVCHVTPDGVELLMNFPRTPFLAGQ